jgi:hypothetical protein
MDCISAAPQLARAELGRVDDQQRQRAADTVVNSLGKGGVPRRAEEIELAGLVPVMHDSKAVEQRHILLLGDESHGVVIGRH